MARLQAALPHLFVLGPYASIKRTGPAIWLRCVVDRVLPSFYPNLQPDVVPVLYLPGVTRQSLHAGDECPDHDAARRQIQVHHLDTGPLKTPSAGWRRKRAQERTVRIVVTSVLVDDQDKALRFHTDVLGFVKKTEVPLGVHRWLTVVSPDDLDGVELVLEPDEHPAAKPSKRALVEDGIPVTSFQPPVEMGIA